MNVFRFIWQFLAIQAVMFGVVIYFLRRMMLGSTESAVKRLDESYMELNARKDKLGKLIKAAEEEYQKKKEESDQIVKKMRDETQREVDEKRDKLLKKAHDEAERILSDTVSATERIHQQIRREEEMKAVDRAEELLEEALGEVLTEKVDRMLIKDFLTEFTSTDQGNIPPSVTDVVLITSSQLTDEERATISAAIERKAGRRLKIEEKRDPKVLGGIIMKFGSLILDGSLASKFKEAAVRRKVKIEQTT